MKALNLTPKLIEAIRDSDATYQSVAPGDAGVRRRIAEALGTAQHFLLPEGGLVIDWQAITRDTVPLMVVPAPICTFEFMMPPDDDIGPGQQSSRRRIALVWTPNADWEPSPGFNANVARGESGFFVSSWYEHDAVHGQPTAWESPPLAVFFPHDQESPLGGAPNSAIDAKLGQSLDRDVIIENTPNFRRAILFPGLYRLMVDRLGNEQAAIVESLKNMHDEWIATLCALLFLSARNVETLELPAPTGLNRKRVAKGRPALPAYHVLAIRDSTGVRATDVQRAGPARGPRTHFRRAHLRRLHRGTPEERLVAVRHTIVNPEQGEPIDKAYRLG